MVISKSVARRQKIQLNEELALARSDYDFHKERAQNASDRIIKLTMKLKELEPVLGAQDDSHFATGV